LQQGHKAPYQPPFSPFFVSRGGTKDFACCISPFDHPQRITTTPARTLLISALPNSLKAARHAPRPVKYRKFKSFRYQPTTRSQRPGGKRRHRPQTSMPHRRKEKQFLLKPMPAEKLSL
jgi:hypothetical protein